jgi:hypothetical protein
MTLPSIRAVAEELAGVKDVAREYRTGIEVRLQCYYDGEWGIRWGDPSYDTDHNGYWGCGIVDNRSNCYELARDLLEQVREDYCS